MIQAFLRELKVSLVAGQDIIEIKSDGTPNNLKVTCAVTKTVMGIPNPSIVSIWNLSNSTRTAIQKSLSNITVEAGWLNTEKNIIFAGNVMACVTERSGADIITKLTCVQGYNALVKGITSKTWAEGTPILSVIKDLGASLEGITVAENKIKGVSGKVGAGGWSFAGSTKDALNQLANEYGFSWTIDEEALSVISDSDSFTNIIQINGNKGGLINISPILTGPMQEQTGVKIKALYIPGVVPGSIISVKSSISEGLNGDYKVHTANYSLDTFSNSWTMDLESFNYL